VIFSHFKKKFAPQGFTLIEVAVTIILIGVVVSLALPQFSITTKRSRSSEGVQILSAIWRAQNLYTFENGSAAGNLTDLDIEIPSPLTNFNTPVLYTTDGQTAYIVDNNSDYRLYIDTTGTITCDDTPGLAGICAKMAFAAYPY